MADIQSQLPVKITNGTNTVGVTVDNALKVEVFNPVTTVSVGNFPVTQPVSGTVSISNLPATQPVSGAVSVSNFPATQPVSGSVSISNFPATQPVSISGVVATTEGEVSSGVVNFYNNATNIANNAAGTVTYTVTSGKTFYLKQAMASSSGGPCKVVVTTGTGPSVTQAVAFYSAASPFVTILFAQPIPVAAGAPVAVQIWNSAGVAQDVYASINGHEV